MKELSKYTERQLLQELLNRLCVEKQVIHQWCDDCMHFKILTVSDNQNKNPCIKSHKMQFQSPEGYGDEYGFYRVGCKDRLNKVDILV